MPASLIVRLWGMVFLHYFVWGSWYVTMGTYLEKTLKFAGYQIGLAYGTTAVGAMVSPFLAGVLADRWFATQRLLGSLHLLGALLLVGIASLGEFVWFYPALVLYTISYMAGHGLTNSLTLHHAPNPQRDFPIVMTMGSVGWIASGWVVSWLKVENSPGMFYLAAGAALLMGCYSLTLPHTPPSGKATEVSWRERLGLDALRLFRDRAFATFMLCSFLICIPLSFYFSWMNLFMNELQIPDAAAKMTLGQVSDVIFLLLLPALLARIGVKGILLLGMTAWAARFALLAWFPGHPEATWALYLAIGIHGLCYDYIFVMGRMYVDRRAGSDIRGAAQGLHALLTLGVGMFFGTWLAGVVGGRYTTATATGTTHQWQPIWLLPAGLSAVLLIAFALFFTDRADRQPEDHSSATLT